VGRLLGVLLGTLLLGFSAFLMILCTLLIILSMFLMIFIAFLSIFLVFLAIFYPLPVVFDVFTAILHMFPVVLQVLLVILYPLPVVFYSLMGGSSTSPITCGITPANPDPFMPNIASTIDRTPVALYIAVPSPVAIYPAISCSAIVGHPIARVPVAVGIKVPRHPDPACTGSRSPGC